jgi:FKBP-type peptidyl-prolyl cis-trans isomerase SlyD
MYISEGKMVSLTYRLNLKNTHGELIEKVEKEKPLEFLFGTGYLLPRFEQYLSGLKMNDPFTFSLSAEEAYGSVREEAIVEIPLQSFEVNGKLNEEMMQVGKKVPMIDQAGARVTGTVIAVGEEYVTMDFNHPLAGRDLYFEGEILEIREPTEDDLHRFSPHSHDSCGCGSGGCEDDSCECSTEAEGSSCGCGH